MESMLLPKSKGKIDAACHPVVEDNSSCKVQLGGGTRKIKKKIPAQTLKKQKWTKEWYKPGGEHPQALAGLSSFIQPEKNPKAKKEKEQWLENQDTFQIHKPARKHYPRRPFVVYALDEQWQADLCDLTWHKAKNGGHGWVLVVVDVLSRKCWMAALKQKSGAETARGLKEVFDRVQEEKSDHTLPRFIYADKGTEFYNHNVKTLLSTYPIPPQLQSGFSTTKAAIAERLIRTLKTKLWRHFHASGTYEWVDTLPQIVDSYNHTKHRSIKRPPITVHRGNEEEVWKTLYGKRQQYRDKYSQASAEKKELYFKFKIGNVVRISKQAVLFRKGYLPQWTEEWFKVRARDEGPPPYYRLEEYQGVDGKPPEILTGTFYEPEMQLVSQEYIKEARFRIESILKRRPDPNNKKRTQVFVKYKGWPDHYNQWIDESQVESLS